jgi:succinoglycan biosynthesis transport protein ExoP
MLKDKAAHCLDRAPLTFSGVIRRHIRLILCFIAFGAGLGAILVVTAPPSYRANVTLVIDPRRAELLQKNSVLGGLAFDEYAFPTYVEVLRSQAIALAVITDLELNKDPEFVGSPSLLERAARLVFGGPGPDEPDSERELTRRALASFEKHRLITQIQQSHLIRISFTASDPDKAGRIAKAIGMAYISAEMRARQEAAARAGIWLAERTAGLRQQALEAERAVAEFRTKNAIVFTALPKPACLPGAGERGKKSQCVPSCGKAGCGETGASEKAAKCRPSGRIWCRKVNGSLLAEQSVGKATAEAARNAFATAEAQARAKHIETLRRDDDRNPSLADALSNRVIAKLRGQYAELAKREALWAQKYGAGHFAVIDLRRQMQEVNRSLNDEMRRVEESYKSDAEIGRMQDRIGAEDLAKDVAETQRVAKVRAELRELETHAATLRSLYNILIQRSMEIAPQQSSPINEARLIGPEPQAIAASKPNPKILLLFGSGLGLILGFAAAALRDLIGTGIRTRTEVEEALGVRCLAILPRLKLDPAADGAATPFHETDRKAAAGRADPFAAAATAPNAQFMESLRSLKLAIDLNGGVDHKTVGVTSAFPNEGKSTVAANLAQLITESGAAAVLVDADLRNPTLSATFAPDSAATWSDVLAGRATLEEALWRDPETNVTVLPAGMQGRTPCPAGMSNLAEFGSIIAELRQRFAYVILDLPPMAPVSDARALAGSIDSYLCVVSWSSTHISDLDHFLAQAPEVHDRLIGVVLNNADMSILGRLDPYDRIVNDPKYYASFHASRLYA